MGSQPMTEHSKNTKGGLVLGVTELLCWVTVLWQSQPIIDSDAIG